MNDCKEVSQPEFSLLSEREKNVSHYYLSDDKYADTSESSAIAGNKICWDDNLLSPFNVAEMHDMHLIAALLPENKLSDQFKDSIVRSAFLDKNLYYYDVADKENVNFFIKALQKQTKEAQWLNLIAQDIEKISSANNPGNTNQKLLKGLYSALAEYWYFNDSIPKDSAFIKIEAGIQVDFTKFNAQSDKKGINGFHNGLAENAQRMVSGDARLANFFNHNSYKYNVKNIDIFTIGLDQFKGLNTLDLFPNLTLPTHNCINQQ